MDIWLAVRTFISVFFVAFGIGLIFVSGNDSRLMLGAAFVGLGATVIWSMMLRSDAKRN